MKSKPNRKKCKRHSRKSSSISSSAASVESVASVASVAATVKNCNQTTNNGSKRNDKNHENINNENHYYNTGYNISNMVPIQNILRSILHESFPILFLPEYSQRRCTFEQRNLNYNFRNHNNDNSNCNARSNHSPTSRNESKMKQGYNKHDHTNTSSIFQLPQQIQKYYTQYLTKKSSNRNNYHYNSYNHHHCHRRYCYSYHHRHKYNPKNNSQKHPTKKLTQKQNQQQLKNDEKNQTLPSLLRKRKIHHDLIDVNDFDLDDDDDDDDICRLVRVIVIPLSSYLISKVAYPLSLLEHTDMDKSHGNTIHSETIAATPTVATYATTTTTTTNSAPTTTNSAPTTQTKNGTEGQTLLFEQKDTNDNIATNNYNNDDNDKNNNTSSHHKNNEVIWNKYYNTTRKIPKLFQVNESTTTIVDGVISTLVQQRQRLSTHGSSSSSNGSCGNSSKKKKRSFAQLMTTCSFRTICHGKNLLSQGYNYASSDHCNHHHSQLYSHSMMTHSTTKTPKRRKVASVAQCKNMTSGIQCTQLNSCASYARCSSLMNKIHHMLGDDLMREMLLNCIILIPIGKCYDISHHHKHHSQGFYHNEDTNCGTGGGNDIENGNYFQLCGPSLSWLNKRARPDNFIDNKLLSSQSVCEKKKKKHKNHNDYVTYATDNHNHDSTRSKVTSMLSSSDITSVQQWVVPRHRLLYSESFIPKVGLPSLHLLNQWNKSNTTTKKSEVETKLLDAIVQFHSANNNNKRRKRWMRLRSNGIAICREIFKRHEKCDYARLLERYCPLPAWMQKKNGTVQNSLTNDNTKNIAEVGKCWSGSDNVISFLSAVLKFVFPLSFWGSEYNFQVVLSAMKTFINLRIREQFPLKCIVHGIRVLDLKWLFHPSKSTKSRQRDKILKSDHEAATVLMQNQMKWLYCSFLIPLLRSIFYITDTEFTGKRIVFYRKPVWSKFRSLALDQLLEEQYKLISEKEAMELYGNQPMGFSRLRLLPKETGFRPITLSCRNEDLKVTDASSDSFQKKRLSTNVILKPISDVLKHEYKKDPKRYGVGVEGFDRVYEKIKSFVQELKCLSPTTGTSNMNIPLFFCSVDIKKCYDNINQAHLFDIIKGIIQEDEYLIHQNTILNKGDGDNSVRRKQSKTIGRQDILSALPDLAEKLSITSSKAIILDNSKLNSFSRDYLIDLLHVHLFGNVVISRQKFGPKYLSQRSGIPQGSVLSTTLCNYYFGNTSIESCIMKGCFCNKSSSDVHLMVRVVDDFLFVTTNRNAIEKFMENMLIGNTHLGVQINESKSRVSHDTLISLMDMNGKQDKQILRSSLIKKGDDTYFQWCGLLINSATFAVHIDYSRFLGTTATDSLTIDRVKNSLFMQMKSFVTPRCQPLLFDPNINGKKEIHINFYQVITYAAIKTVNYIEGMSGGLTQNRGFVFSCVMDLINYALDLILYQLQRCCDNRCRRQYCLDKLDGLWLGIHSFEVVLHQAGDKSFHKFAFLFQSFRKKLKIKSVHKYLCEVANEAMMKFGINSFEFGNCR